LYAGISNYNDEQTKGCRNPQRLGTPCLINQAKYSMFVREPEAGLLDVLEEKR
jgi:L-glyceraldehyde 3-phosphate reductase